MSSKMPPLISIKESVSVNETLNKKYINLQFVNMNFQKDVKENVPINSKYELLKNVKNETNNFR
jgi:hypothetical protein